MAGPGDTSIRTIARKCREAGPEIRKEFAAAMQREARPAIVGIRQEAKATLPKSGGNQVRRSRMVKTGTVTIDGQEFYRKTRKALNTFKPNESLADRVANASYTARVLSKGLGQLQIKGSARRGGRMDLDSINNGIVHHPIFGHRDRWDEQHVQPGFFTRACEANKDQVLQGLREAAETIANYLEEL